MKDEKRIKMDMTDTFRFLEGLGREKVDELIVSHGRDYDGLPLLAMYFYNTLAGAYVVSRFDGEHYDRASVEYARRVLEMFPERISSFYLAKCLGMHRFKLDDMVHGYETAGERRSVLRKCIRERVEDMDAFAESVLRESGMASVVRAVEGCGCIDTYIGGETGWRYTFVQVVESKIETPPPPSKPWWLG